MGWLLSQFSWGGMYLWAIAFAYGQSPEGTSDFKVTPAEVVLTQPEATQQLLVVAKSNDGRTIDATRTVKYRSLNPEIATVDETGLVRPQRDGQTSIEVELATHHVRIAVRNEQIDQPRPISFSQEIIPLLTKSGCNVGGCHGKAEGQNGFKLSVFGFDPQADHEAIALNSRSRRVSLANPENSLLLRKATASVPHGGGQSLEPNSLRYRRLLRWIAEGAAFDGVDLPEIVRIEVEPRDAILLAHQSQQLRVWAVDSQGNRKCVTTEAEYESNAPALVGVDGRALMQTSELPGEAAVMAKYLGHVAICRVTSPRPDVKFARPAENNFIDRLAWDQLQRLGIEPSPVCDDATFLRRAYLDVIGTLPTAKEAREFLSDTAANKRALLVDQLLERNEYADYWTMRFSDLLRVDQTKITPAGAVAITRWLRRQFSENQPYDTMVRELLLAKGNLNAEGPAAYFKALDTPELLAQSVCQTFLGVRIECAQCHHHPSDRWSQDDYFAVAGLFSSVGRKKLADGGDAIVISAGQDFKHPRTGQLVPARTLLAQPSEFARYEDRRVRLVQWMTDPSNPFFAKMIANRLWAHYFGRGLVEQIDDLRTTNPPTNEPLLDALAEQMKALNYDLKAFTRLLLTSNLYQLSSTPTTSNVADTQNFSHAAFKALPAEVLLDSICQATGVPENYAGWPEGVRAIQIWDNKLPHYFLRIFGRPVRATVCECERGNEPSIAQALHLTNSPEIMAKLRAPTGLAAKLAQESSSTTKDLQADSLRRTIDELFLSAVSRYPDAKEQASAYESMMSTADRREACEDILWALLNSKEFLYNH